MPWFQQAAAADPERQATLRLAEGRLRAAMADGAGAADAFRQGLAAAKEGPARAQLAAALAEQLEATVPPVAVIQQLEPWPPPAMRRSWPGWGWPRCGPAAGTWARPPCRRSSTWGGRLGRGARGAWPGRGAGRDPRQLSPRVTWSRSPSW
ncbi:MAG: hypothetical protein R3F43_19850 [bacterium]